MGSQTVKMGRHTRRAAWTAVAVLALGASACSSSPAGDASAVALSPPSTPLSGCTYTVNGKVEPYLPTGVNPNFAGFSPDPSAESALDSIKHKGGTGAVDTFVLPGGTKLRSGPSSSAPVVGTVPEKDQLEVFDPIVWRDSGGGEWLATFVACGGRNLYWVGLEDLRQTDPAFAETLSSQLAELQIVGSYLKTARASDLPIVIDSSHQVVWKDSAITFNVGRSELVSALV